MRMRRPTISNILLVFWALSLLGFAAHRITAQAAEMPTNIAKSLFARPASLISLDNRVRTNTTHIFSSSATVVLVRTTCTACNTKAPTIRRIVERSQDGAFLLALDFDTAAVRRYAQASGISFNKVLIPADSVARASIGVRFVPSLVLARGGAIAVWHGLPTKSQMLLGKLRL
jgi:hypothetical protein